MNQWARAISKWWWVWAIGWPVVAAVVYLPAPRIPTLLADSARGFIPQEMPSQRALAKLREEFPQFAPASRAAIIFARDGGLNAEDSNFITKIERKLMAESPRWGWTIQGETSKPFLRPVLRSPDGAVAVIGIDLPADMLTHSTVNRVREIQRIIAVSEQPTGLDVDVTGGGALGELLEANTRQHIGQTKLWTFIGVTVVLLLIYRSPVAMFLPILTVLSALMVSLGAIGWAASSWLPISGLLEVFIIVLVGGCGVDYCLLLFARFQEELGRGADVRTAVEAALARCGWPVIAGASTVAAALTTMIFAHNRDVYTSGPTIAFAVAICTFSTLTFTPAMMVLFGRSLLRPRPIEDKDAPTVWHRLAGSVVAHPARVAGLILVLLVPCVVAGTRVPLSFDSLSEFSPDASYVRGAKRYPRHFFQADAVSEVTVLLTAATELTADESRGRLDSALDRLYTALREKLPVVYQRDLRDPLGTSRTADATPLEQNWSQRLSGELAADYYLGESGKTVRVDVGLSVDPRSPAAFQMMENIRQIVETSVDTAKLSESGPATVELSGETPTYADIESMRARDFRVLAAAASVAVFAILLILTRSAAQSMILIGSTLAIFFAAYGITAWFFDLVFGLPAINWHVPLLLFLVILSLGQDYNIFVVARIQEERTRFPLDTAVARGIASTGGVVSSCGLIMAASFASLFAGSVMVMKQMAVALTVGILLDTFLVRPLLVPALILMVERRRQRTAISSGELVAAAQIPLQALVPKPSTSPMPTHPNNRKLVSSPTNRPPDGADA